MSDRSKLRDYINDNVIFRYNPEKRYNEQYVGGGIPNNKMVHHGRPWHIFMRRLTHNVDMMFTVCDAMARMYDWNSDKDFQLAGLETGSLPLLSHLQMYIRNEYQYPVNVFTIRKERKSYGLFHYIEGIPNEHQVIMVDDFVNTGSAFQRLYYTIDKEVKPYVEITDAWCILKVKNEENDLVKSIFTLDEFDLKFDPEKYWEPSDVI